MENRKSEGAMIDILVTHLNNNFAFVKQKFRNLNKNYFFLFGKFNFSNVNSTVVKLRYAKNHIQLLHIIKENRL